MSIKSCFQELYVGKQECNIISAFGKKVNLPYSKLKYIGYRYATVLESGYVEFKLSSDKIKRFDFTKKTNKKISKAINFITESAPDLDVNEIDGNNDKFYQTNVFIILMLLLCCSPLGFILMLCYKKFTKPMRTFLTIFILSIWTLGIYNFTASFIGTMNAFNNLTNSMYEVSTGSLPSANNTSEEPSTSTEVETESFTTTLTTGHYVVGIDIPEGTYDFYSKSGSGNFISDDQSINVIFSSSDSYTKKTLNDLGVSDFGTKELKNIYLTDGVTLTIAGSQQISAGCSDGLVKAMTVREQDDLKEIEVGYGLFVAGDDFPVGTYDIEWIEGSGNIITDPGDINTGINEIMGKNNTMDDTLKELKEFEDAVYIEKFKNLILKENDILKIEELKVKLIPSK